MTDHTQSQAPILSAELAEQTIDRYELVETQYGFGHTVHWDKGLEIDPSGEWCKYEDVRRLLAAAPAVPAQEQGVSRFGSPELQAMIVARAAQEQSDSVHWDLLPAYMIDHHEGEVIGEEHLQSIVAWMLKDPDYLRIAAERLAAQEQAASCPDGWKLVPIEPTMEMVDAVANINDAHTSTWATYLAAAPTPPAAPQPRELTDAESAAQQNAGLVVARLEQIAGNFTDDPREAAEQALVCARAIARHLAAPAQKEGAAPVAPHQEGEA